LGGLTARKKKFQLAMMSVVLALFVCESKKELMRQKQIAKQFLLPQK
jgi:hypothetical protein